VQGTKCNGQGAEDEGPEKFPNFMESMKHSAYFQKQVCSGIHFICGLDVVFRPQQLVPASSIPG